MNLLGLHSEQLIKGSLLFLHVVLIIVVIAGLIGREPTMVVSLVRELLSAISWNILFISGHKNAKLLIDAKFGTKASGDDVPK